VADVNRDEMLAEVVELRQRRKEPLPPGGGGGTFDGMEARVAVLETNIGHIKEDLTEIRKDVRELRSDVSKVGAANQENFKLLLAADEKNFRILFGAIIAVALGLAGLMAKGFHWF